FQDPIDILLVEDSDPDALLVTHAFGKARLLNRLHRVADGLAALEFLRQQGDYISAPRPHLILLDLHLPKRTGREVLEDVKKDMDLRSIPVVVFTASRSEEDIADVYALHANCCIHKPVSPEGFSLVIQALEDFWFSVVTLPPAEENIHGERKKMKW
ncbi:MAG: response regulator, partial [Verrucomicrobiaceae bacterium]